MEKLINARQCMADDCDDENEENSFAEEVDEVEKVDEKIATYTDEIITKKFETVLHREGGNTAALFADVSVLVKLEDGEGAMLSKHYEAYVLNDENGEVEKKKVEELKVGDEMVF